MNTLPFFGLPLRVYYYPNICMYCVLYVSGCTHNSVNHFGQPCFVLNEVDLT